MTASKKIWVLALLVAVILGLFAGTAMAQDGDEAAAPESRTLGDNTMASMPVGGIIILLSIAALGLIIEYFISIRRDKIIPPEVISELEILFDEEDYEGALGFCESTPGFVTNVVAASLPRMSQGFEAMENAMIQIGEEEAVKLQLKISFLSLCASIGPMTGLFGTVTGMVSAFNTIATSAGGATPQELADGISMALMTTVMGLIVAIPSMAFYFFFKNKVTRVILEAQVICSELIDRFRPVEA